MEWVRGKRLGQGSFATVSLAVPKSQRPNFPPLMAVKSCGASLSSSLVSEKLILEDLKDCPEIIRCFGDSISCENGEKLYNVLLEYASGGNLADKVRSSGGRGLPEIEVRGYTKTLLKGLKYIHESGYVHCDFKLQNILLCADGSTKIADFGLARRAGRKGAVLGCELIGTPMYMSPEMVVGGEQGTPTDIWAMGCAVAEMASGVPAWSGFSDVGALLMRIGVGDQVPKVPRNLSDEGKDFIRNCFIKDPNQRWTVEMLLNHPFISVDQDLDDDDCEAALKDSQEKIITSTSPRCPFDFVDWVKSITCSATSSLSDFQSFHLGFREEPLFHLRFCEEPSITTAIRISSCKQVPDWSVSINWITIRYTDKAVTPPAVAQVQLDLVPAERITASVDENFQGGGKPHPKSKEKKRKEDEARKSNIAKTGGTPDAQTQQPTKWPKTVQKSSDNDLPKLRTRNYGHILVNALKQMNNQQRATIQKMGFRALFELNVTEIPTAMSYWLLDNFDPKASVVKLCDNKFLHLEPEDVSYVLGIPSENTLIKRKPRNKINDVVEAWKSFYPPNATNMTSRMVIDKMIQQYVSSIWFKLYSLY